VDINTLALVLLLAVYDLLMRRVNARRWLFGMRATLTTCSPSRSSEWIDE
jgi:hypothetical protein